MEVVDRSLPWRAANEPNAYRSLAERRPLQAGYPNDWLLAALLEHTVLKELQ